MSTELEISVYNLH